MRDDQPDQEPADADQLIATVASYREAVLTLIPAYFRDASHTEVRAGKTNARIVAGLVRSAAGRAAAITRIELPPVTAESLADLVNKMESSLQDPRFDEERPVGAAPRALGHGSREHNLIVRALQRIYDRARTSVVQDGDPLLLAESLVHLSGRLRRLTLIAAFESAPVRVHTPIRVWVDVDPEEDADASDLSYARSKRGGWSLPQTEYLFATRKPLIRSIAAESRAGCRRIALWGLPGMGKTQAAVHLAAAIAGDTTDVVGFIAVRGHSSSPLPPDDMFRVALSRVSGVVLSRSPEDTVADAESLFIRALGSQRAVLIFDDVTIEHAVALSQIFPPPGLTMLITTRGELPLRSFQWFALGELDVDDAIVFMARTSGRQFRDDDSRRIAARIVRQCCYVPLCISAVGAVLALEKTLRVEALAEELQSYSDVLALQHPHENALLSAVFEASYRRLQPEAQAVFLRMSLFEGSFSREAQAVVCEDPHSRAARDVMRAGLLRLTHGDLYDLHDLVRAYAVWKYVAQTTPEQRCRDLSRAARYYLPLLEEAVSVRWTTDGEPLLKRWNVASAPTVSRIARELFSGACSHDEDTLLGYALEIAAKPADEWLIPGISSETLVGAIEYCLDREGDPRLIPHLPFIYQMRLHEHLKGEKLDQPATSYWIDFARRALEASERAAKPHWVDIAENWLVEFCDRADDVAGAIGALRPLTQSAHPRRRAVEVLAELLLLANRPDEAYAILARLTSDDPRIEEQDLLSLLRHPRQVAMLAVIAAVRAKLNIALTAANFARTLLDQPGSYSEEPAYRRETKLQRTGASLVALEARLLVAQGNTAEARRLLERIEADGAIRPSVDGEIARAMFEAGLMREAERVATRQIKWSDEGFRCLSRTASAYDVRAKVRKQTGDRRGSIRDAEAAAALLRRLGIPSRSWLTTPFPLL